MWGFYGALAFFIIKGANWARLVLGGFVLLIAFAELRLFFVIGSPIRRSAEIGAFDNLFYVAHIIALCLCFLPAANRYFRRNEKPVQSSPPTAPANLPPAGQKEHQL